MHSNTRHILALILFASFFASAATLVAPAVDDKDHGILTAVTVDITPGSGELVLRLKSTTVAADTQESMQTAFAEAAKIAERNYNSYDYFVHFDSEIGKVNGPSAGAALAIMAYSEYTETPIRNDFIITGTINKGGAIGAVGGVKAKIDAAGANKSFRVMLIPAGQTQESGESVLDSIFYADYALQKYNITVVAVSNISYAIAIATGKIEPPKVTNASDFIPPEYLSAKSSEPFKEVSASTISDSEASGQSSNLNDLHKKAFDRLIAESKMQLSLGYYYSAANTAFLVKNAVLTDQFRNMTIENFSAIVENFDSELSQMRFAEKNATNWEWVATSQMRHNWAVLRVSSIKAKLASNKTITNTTLAEMANDLSAAMGWFEAAKLLNTATYERQDAGSFMPEANAKEQAEKYVKMVEDTVNHTVPFDQEIMNHLNSSKELLAKGDYYAAMMDVSYSHAYLAVETILLDNISQADDAIASSSLYVSGMMNAVMHRSHFANENTRAGWADLFFGHAFYNFKRGEKNSEYGSMVNAIKLAALSDSFQAVSDFAFGNAFITPANFSLITLAPLEQEPKTPETISTPAPQVISIDTGNTSEASGQQNDSGISTSITVKPDSNNSSLQIIAGYVLVAILAMIGVAAFIATRKAFRKPEDLDALYAQGKISRKRYEALRQKYFPKQKQAETQDVEAKWSEQFSAPQVQMNSKKALFKATEPKHKKRIYKKAQ
ncbi:MAG: S16 family serine protease [Candidatus Micrarchaeia archaeon]|jgi:predicted S18 family serine protease